MPTLLFVVLTSHILGETRPDWIPVGAVSPALERHALHHREYLQSRSREIQRAGLQAIRSDLDRFDRADLRIAVVPLVVDMLGLEYRILSVSSAYQVDPPTRMEALHLLADIGGDRARSQLRESLTIDEDGTVRTTAASLLARYTGTDPDEDLQAISRSLYRAVQRGGPEEELFRLIAAASVVSREAWNRDVPELLQALGAVSSGNYSSSLRRTAFSMLEELARR